MQGREVATAFPRLLGDTGCWGLSLMGHVAAEGQPVIRDVEDPRQVPHGFLRVTPPCGVVCKMVRCYVEDYKMLQRKKGNKKWGKTGGQLVKLDAGYMGFILLFSLLMYSFEIFPNKRFWSEKFQFWS